MPCTDGGVPYPLSREEVLDAKAPAMLCALLRAMPEVQTVLRDVDWGEAGVSPQEFAEWWQLHQQRDAARREWERQNQARDSAKKAALDKLTEEERKALGL